MADAINNPIPLVPENVVDVAAAINEAVIVIDALLQLGVQSVGDNSPPGSPAEGDRYIVGTLPSGAWSGHAGQLARYESAAWHFYNARYAFNLNNSRMYARRASGVWASAAGTDTGWTVGSGTANKGVYNANTATTAQNSARILAIEQALVNLGLLSA